MFSQTKLAGIVEEKLFEYRDRGFLRIHRYVVMPDHLHVILTPRETTTLEKAVQLIKGGSSRAVGARFPVWQPGFAEHFVRDDADYAEHARYIDLNPVKARLAEKPEDYPFCSAHGNFVLDPWSAAPGAKAPRRAAAN